MEFKVGDLVVFDREHAEKCFKQNSGWKKINKTKFLVKSRYSYRFDTFELGKVYQIININKSYSFIYIDGDPSNENWSVDIFRHANAIEVARWKLKNDA